MRHFLPEEGAEVTLPHLGPVVIFIPRQALSSKVHCSCTCRPTAAADLKVHNAVSIEICPPRFSVSGN